MELSHNGASAFFEVSAFLLLCLINLGGYSLLGFGLLVPVPWTLCSLTIHLEDVFGIS